MILDEHGLTSKEVSERIKEFGPNVLPEQPRPAAIQILFAQLQSPLVYVLLIAGTVTLFLRHIADSSVIFLSVLINTVFGFIQERKAGNAFAALNQFIVHTSEVIRNGERVKVDTSEIVPGDVVVLIQGSKVPADGMLLFANRVYFEEAILTGESVSVAKEIGDQIFMGTTVQTGNALMRTTQTGSRTRIGHIAQEIQSVEADTPLKQQLANFSNKLVILILSLITFVFIIGLLRGDNASELFTTSVALAVSSIPEGLVVSLTVVLAIGMQKILKRKGLVRKLTSAETLGGVTTICLDKTGTLTAGQMKVVGYIGQKHNLAKQVLLANDLDDPIVIAAYAWGEEVTKLNQADYKRLDSIPFSSKERLSVSLHKWDEQKNMIFVNGAPDVLLQNTTLSATEREEIIQKIDALTSSGKRLMGLARKEVPLKVSRLKIHDAKSNLEWVGILEFDDPVRPSVKNALEQTRLAGIRTIVITGDYAKTAQFVLAEVGIPVTDQEIMLGAEMESIGLEELSEKVKTIKLFARTTPDQKNMIVQALQKNREVVGMMGDGVNDAPAIHQADIGIVVNDASDVARESADLVLLDSNFSTVVSAVEEGRSIFDNIRKILLYLLSGAFAEIIVVIASIILKLPLPITAIQIIWINLVSDGLPGLALTVDPSREGIMKEKPRKPDEKLMSNWMFLFIFVVSLCAGSIALAVFVVTYRMTGDLVLARSLTFLTLGLNSLTYVFSVRSLLTPFWKSNIFANKWLIAAVMCGYVLEFIPFSTQSTRAFFKLSQITLQHWLGATIISIGLFFVVELLKIIWYVKYHKKTSH